MKSRESLTHELKEHLLYRGLRPLHGQLAFSLDATFFTDKEAQNPVRPSELDLTPEIIVREGRYEVHLAYEHDMPVDSSGLTQRFVYLLGACSF